MINKPKNYSFYASSLVVLTLLGVLPTKFSAGSKLFSVLQIGHSQLAPFYWCLLVLLIACVLPRVHVPGRLCLKGHILGFSVAGAVLFIALRYLAGVLLHSLSATPYDMSPAGIAINLINIVPFTAARELVRAYALGTANIESKKPAKWVILVTLLMAFTDINIVKISLLASFKDWFIYIASEVLPALAQSAAITVFTLCGGFSAGFIYIGGMNVFLHIIPFLPSLPWIAESAFGIVFPILLLLFVEEQYKMLTHTGGRSYKKSNIFVFSGALAVSVLLLWFIVGVFPVFPSVVLTGSMEPKIYPGDVVLISKITKENEIYALSESDIINFKREDISITHRIQKVITDENGNICFETKGDNNKSADDQLVLPNDINGIVKSIIPKIGVPVLMLFSEDYIPEGVVDN